MYKRIIILVMDSVGIGHAPDAANFNDEGATVIWVMRLHPVLKSLSALAWST